MLDGDPLGASLEGQATLTGSDLENVVRRPGKWVAAYRHLVTDLKPMKEFAMNVQSEPLRRTVRLRTQSGRKENTLFGQTMVGNTEAVKPMAKSSGRAGSRLLWTTSFLVLGGWLLAAPPAAADEGGVSFWLPGQFGSFAAVPGEPGWTLPIVYYHTSTDAGADQSFRRGGRITAGLDVRADLAIVAPTYVFSTPVAGGQAALGFAAIMGRAKVGTSATLTGPFGGTLTGGQTDTLDGVGDLYPTGSIKWNQGNHNYMAYTMAGVPVGSYSADRLANLGTNHWSLDAGGGYTYLDPKKGHEFSAVLGFTYNWKNDDTDYKNGTSAHLDWAASQFFSEQFHAGLVGYFYNQLNGDSGTGAVLGDFKSRVSGIGPQIGYFFPVGKQKWYVNLKGYHEFNAKNRPEGWNVWVTLAIPLGSTGK